MSEASRPFVVKQTYVWLTNVDTKWSDSG